MQIGAEPGRLLRPYAFDLAPDGRSSSPTRPGNGRRIQLFLTIGIAHRRLHAGDARRAAMVLDNVVISGIGSLAYTGRSIYLSQPETGAR